MQTGISPRHRFVDDELQRSCDRFASLTLQFYYISGTRVSKKLTPGTALGLSSSKNVVEFRRLRAARKRQPQGECGEVPPKAAAERPH